MTSGFSKAHGTFFSAASLIATPAAYPPKPSAAAGFLPGNSERTRSLVCRQPRQNFSSPAMVRTGGTIGCGINSNPVGSRITRSISRIVQRNTGFTCGAIRTSDCATTIPGYKCPPVPPPANKIVIESDIGTIEGYVVGGQLSVVGGQLSVVDGPWSVVRRQLSVAAVVSGQLLLSVASPIT